MKIKIELSQDEIKNMILDHIRSMFDTNEKIEGNLKIERKVQSGNAIDPEDHWMEAEFRAVYETP